MKKMHLGAQLYTIREFMKNETDFRASMKKISDIGYRYVQVSGIGEVSPRCIKQATEECGLKVILTHTPVDAILHRTDEVIANHDLFGCDIIGLGSLPGDYQGLDGYKRFAETIAPAVETIKKAGKKFSYHNHSHEFEKQDGKHFLEVLLDNSDKDAFFLTVDCYWLHYAGLDVPEWLAAHHSRISVTHLKDLGVYEGKPGMIEVMTGNMNYPKILKTCADNDILWHFVEQDTTRLDPFESLKISYDNLMSTGYFD